MVKVADMDGKAADRSGRAALTGAHGASMAMAGQHSDFMTKGSKGQ